MKIDWKLKLFQILDAVSAEEGIIFENCWTDFGITEEEKDCILKEYETSKETIKL